MPQPDPYEREFDFTGFAASNPSTPPPGAQLDAEYNGIAVTLAAILVNLALIQRDDTALANEIVTIDSLHPEVLALLNGGELTINTTVTMSDVTGLTAYLANIIAALDLRQPISDQLSAIAALATTSFGRSLLVLANGGALKTAAGLGSVDNTADADKPVSTAQAAAITAAIDALVAAAPGVLDTLNELAAALGNDSNFAATITAALALKQNRSPAIQTVVSAATVTPTFSNDQVNITAQAAALQLLNWTGTAIPSLGLVVRIKDNGTARAITYDTKYRAMGVALPITTVISKTLYLGFIYNATDDKFDLVAAAQEA